MKIKWIRDKTSRTVPDKECLLNTRLLPYGCGDIMP